MLPSIQIGSQGHKSKYFAKYGILLSDLSHEPNQPAVRGITTLQTLLRKDYNPMKHWE